MKLINILFMVFSFFNSNSSSELPSMTFYDLSIKSIDGNKIDFKSFKGKNVLIVNVASYCGFTNQYKALEELYSKYKDDLIVIGVPCNQFGGQEPNNEQQIQEFCEKNFGVSFLLTEKVDVKGKNQHILYKWLTSKNMNSEIESSVKWNFQKYFVDANGKLVNYFLSTTSPTSSKIISLIEQ